MNSESACKLIIRIPGLDLLISSVPGSAWRTHGESLGKPRVSTSILKALAGKLALFVFLVSHDCCVALPHDTTGLSAVCDCGIS